MIDFKKDINPQKDKNISTAQYIPALFHHEQDLYSSYKKIENITAAVFLVSNLMPDKEILKDTIRGKTISCLSQIVSIISQPNLDVHQLQILASHLLHISSLLDIAFWSGLMSQMNTSVLQSEINSAYIMVSELGKRQKSKFYIEPGFFEVRKDKISGYAEKDIFKDNDGLVNELHTKGQYKGHITKDTVRDIKRQDKRDILSDSKDKRRQAIMALLKEKGNLTVKDFVGVIPGFSEKTIQRELLSLVDEGTVRKEGARRWTTYSLKP